MTLPSIERVSDQRIDNVVPLTTPALLHHELPLDDEAAAAVLEGGAPSPASWMVRTTA